jgi:hypothetical protein
MLSEKKIFILVAMIVLMCSCDENEESHMLSTKKLMYH